MQSGSLPQAFRSLSHSRCSRSSRRLSAPPTSLRSLEYSSDKRSSCLLRCPFRHTRTSSGVLAYRQLKACALAGIEADAVPRAMNINMGPILEMGDVMVICFWCAFAPSLVPTLNDHAFGGVPFFLRFRWLSQTNSWGTEDQKLCVEQNLATHENMKVHFLSAFAEPHVYHCGTDHWRG